MQLSHRHLSGIESQSTSLPLNLSKAHSLLLCHVALIAIVQAKVETYTVCRSKALIFIVKPPNLDTGF